MCVIIYVKFRFYLTRSQERFLNCVDPTTSSCILVTSRIRKLLLGWIEVPLNLLSEKESVDLLLSMGQVEEITESALAAGKKIANQIEFREKYEIGFALKYRMTDK